MKNISNIRIVEIIDGIVQIPEDVRKTLEESEKFPIAYSKDCPKLTSKEISEFRRVADYTFDTKTKTFHPKVQNG